VSGPLGVSSGMWPPVTESMGWLMVLLVREGVTAHACGHASAEVGEVRRVREGKAGAQVSSGHDNPLS